MDVSAEEAFRRRQSKSMLKAEAMMSKFGWAKGKTIGKNEDNPQALQAPLHNRSGTIKE